MPRCEIGQRRIGLGPPSPLGPADRAIGEQGDVVRDAVLGHAAQDVVVLPDAQLDLHRGDLGDAPRLLDLADGDIAEADRLDAPVPLQRRQRADARRQRRSRIEGMELIEMDALDAERAAARVAGGGEVLRPAVGCPAPVRAA